MRNFGSSHVTAVADVDAYVGQRFKEVGGSLSGVWLESSSGSGDREVPVIEGSIGEACAEPNVSDHKCGHRSVQYSPNPNSNAGLISCLSNQR